MTATGKVQRFWTVTTNIVFCSFYNVSSLFRSLQIKEICNVHGVRHSPNILPNMIHGHASRIIARQSLLTWHHLGRLGQLCVFEYVGTFTFKYQEKNRLCTKYKNGCIGDEYHYIMECQGFELYDRKHLIDKNL